jgi:Mg-chelatase subunit ChlD
VAASWVRRTFAGAGVTTYPAGPHLAAIADHVTDRTLLCIDVSGSMHGRRLADAVAGGLDFLGEALHAGYRCGLVLWHHGVTTYLPTTTEPAKVRAALRAARARGGTALLPTLRVAIDELGPMRGDRVVCVFGDGDVGNEQEVAAAAAQARSLGIRFVVRGLGRDASASLARTLLPDEPEEPARTVDALTVRRGIASMASDLRRRPR